jgi:hypothetical protein
MTHMDKTFKFEDVSISNHDWEPVKPYTDYAQNKHHQTRTTLVVETTHKCCRINYPFIFKCHWRREPQLSYR